MLILLKIIVPLIICKLCTTCVILHASYDANKHGLISLFILCEMSVKPTEKSEIHLNRILAVIDAKGGPNRCQFFTQQKKIEKKMKQKNSFV